MNINTVLKRTVRYGTQGDDVALIQRILNKAGLTKPDLNIDSIFGIKSVTKTKEFQRKNALISDGIIGPITWVIFYKLYN